MKVSDWISANPYIPPTISVDSSLSDIITAMLRAPYPKDIYIVANENHIVGHLSLKKIAHQLLPKYQQVHTRRQIMHRIAGGTVRELMNPQFSYATLDEELEDIFHLLLERDIEDLPVLDKQKRLTGGIRLTSLLRHLIDQEETDTLCKI